MSGAAGTQRHPPEADQPLGAQRDSAGAHPLGPGGDRRAILEALLFAADEPLSLDRIAEALEEPDPSAVASLIRDLQAAYAAPERGLMVQEVAGGFRVATKPAMHAWLQRLQRVRPTRLSRAALETLAVIAYRQPVTKAEIEAVRGVNVDGVLRTLLERELIRILGRKAEVGRPILYGTSRAFLEYFGFKDLSELPTLREIEALLAEQRPRATEGEPGGSTTEEDARDLGQAEGPPPGARSGGAEPLDRGRVSPEQGPRAEVGRRGAEGRTASPEAADDGGRGGAGGALGETSAGSLA